MHVINGNKNQVYTCFLPCIQKEAMAKLCMKWTKVIQYAMYFADIARNDACKCSTSLKNYFTCCADKKGEHCIELVCYFLLATNNFFLQALGICALVSATEFFCENLVHHTRRGKLPLQN